MTRVAHTVLRRVAVQRATFLTAYGQARTPVGRLVAAVSGLRAALPTTESTRPAAVPVVSAVSEVPVVPEVSRRLDRVADDLADLLAEIHTAHETAAAAVIRTRTRPQTRTQVKKESRDVAAEPAA